MGKYGAGKESRTLDLNLGKVALYQLSYSRVSTAAAVKEKAHRKDGLFNLVVQGGSNPNQSHTQARIVAQMNAILRCPIVNDQS